MKKFAEAARGVPLIEIAIHLTRFGAGVDLRSDGLRVVAEGGSSLLRVLEPAEASLDEVPLKAVVVVERPLPETFPAVDLQLVSVMNRAASLGAITVSDGSARMVSRLTTYEGDDAWRYHVPLLAHCALQAAQAPLGPGGGALKKIPRRASTWPKADFAALGARHRGRCFCTADDDGFTAEFGLRAGPGASALGDDATALLHMTVRHRHPRHGVGLHLQLDMPHQFSDPARLSAVIARLNEWEAQAGDRVPHYGAWCRGEVDNPAYTCFLPQALWQEGLATSMAIWMRMRALLADGFLVAHGLRAETAV